MFTDSHCHLDPAVYGSEEEVDAVIERARADGLVRLVAIGAGYGLEGARNAIAVAERHPDVWCTVGLHPHEARLWDEIGLELLELAAHPKVAALGEMGLDFYYDLSPREVQRRVLRVQIREALERELPIVIHDRDSHGEVLQTLLDEGAFSGRVLFHCFGGDRAEMERIVEYGGYISIPGIVTFKRPGHLPEVVEHAPLDRLLIETDSPYLTPAPHRGSRNEPRRVVHTAARIAELRGIPVDDVARATYDNLLRFYAMAQA